MRKPSDQVDLHQWWYNALKVGVGVPGKTDVHADKPEPGCYRIRVGQSKSNGQEVFLPVRYYWEQTVDPETGELVDDEMLRCLVGFGPEAAKNGKPIAKHKDGDMLWTWAANRPVSWEAYEAAYTTGKWPDEAPGANFRPGDSFEGLVNQLDAMLANAEAFKEIQDQVTCDQAANLKDRIYKVGKELDAMRDAEKRPFDEQAKAVQAKYRPYLDKVMDAVDRLRLLMTPFMKRAQEAARAAAVEVGAAAPEVHARAGGMEAKRTSTRKVKVVTITDYALAFSHVQADPDIEAAARKVIERRAKAGEKIPGVQISEEIKVI